MTGDVDNTALPLICLVRGGRHELVSLALVLEAMAIDYHIDEQHGTLLVDEAVAVRAATEIELYRLENHDWPTSRPAPPPSGPVAPTALMLAALVLLFGITGPWTLQGEWFARGMVDVQAVAAGQWWRLFTGLTLHADAVHLLGNVLIGGLLIHLLCGSVGYGWGWAMLLCAGGLGNGLNVVLHHSVHHSVGFSTSIFAVIGLLTATEVMRLRQQAWRSMALPIGAGAALLALLGSEGERTDLGAHLFGFVAGLAIGWPLGLQGILRKWREPWMQALLYTLAGLGMVLTWWLAWR